MVSAPKESATVYLETQERTVLRPIAYQLNTTTQVMAHAARAVHLAHTRTFTRWPAYHAPRHVNSVWNNQQNAPPATRLSVILKFSTTACATPHVQSAHTKLAIHVPTVILSLHYVATAASSRQIVPHASLDISCLVLTLEHAPLHVLTRFILWRTLRTISVSIRVRTTWYWRQWVELTCARCVLWGSSSG